MSVQVLQQELIEEAWTTGNLEYLVRPYQRRFYRLLKQALKEQWPLVMIVCCRKFGKTFLLTLIFLEILLTIKYQQLQYYAEDTAKLKARVFPQLKQLLRECPFPVGDTRRPEFKGAGKDRGMDTFCLPCNDTTIEFYPANEDSRGGNPKYAAIDEAAFIKKLNELVNGTIRPAFLQTKGTCALITTPPLSQSHYSHELFLELQKKGRALHGSYEDMISDVKYEGSVSRAEFEEIKESLRDPITGELKAQWYREYMAQFVNDSKLTVFPTWDSKKHVISKDRWNEIRQHPAYSSCLKFAGIDYGTVDFTSICFYTYFKPLKSLIKEAEVMIKGENVIVRTIAQLYYSKKQEVWGYGHDKHPTLVVAECRDKIINQSLRVEHLIPTKSVKKSATKQPMTSALVELISNDEFLVVGENCPFSVKSLEGCIWESEDMRGHRFADGGTLGHFDTCDVDCYVNWEARKMYSFEPAPGQPNSDMKHFDPSTYAPPIPGTVRVVGNPNLLPRPVQNQVNRQLIQINDGLNHGSSPGNILDYFANGI